jgi:ribulose-5-phosphate 4-epimerase/fuculose-1-phosphate aldolase
MSQTKARENRAIRTSHRPVTHGNGDVATPRLMSLRAEVARYAKKMHDSGLVRATQGNLSARDTNTGLVCITPSGAEYDSLGVEDIAVVTAEGEIVEGRWKPSLEMPAHLAVYQRRADVGCVMHTHSIYATVFGVLYHPFPMILAESAYCLGGEVPIAPYQESGTPEFAEMVASYLGDGSAVIWGNHGAMVVGRTVALAYSIAHALEDSARVYWLASQLGQPHALPDDEVRRLHDSWLTSYGQRPLDPLGES